MSRTKNAKRNIVTGIIGRFITMLLPFISRTIIIRILGSEYLGINGLFSSILSVLNLAELGFSGAVIFTLYKPVAEKRDEEVAAILCYLKRIYLVIGSSILGIGLIILPFITLVIKGNYPEDINIYIIFAVYLVDTVTSYFFGGYKTALLNATQRLDVYNNIRTGTILIKEAFQIILLLIFRNYYAFVIIIPFFSLLLNLLLSQYCRIHYKQYIKHVFVQKDVKKGILKHVNGMILDKLCNVSRNSFDSIIISLFFGLTSVAIYNNYYYIYSAIYTLMLIFTNSAQAGVGNSIQTESVEKNYEDFIKFNFLLEWLIGWATICLACLYQPFMELWIGEELMFNNSTMLLFCLYFYLINLTNVRDLYFQGCGLWSFAKLTFILEAISNLVLNVLLGTFIGINGIIIATIITIAVYNVIIRTYILYRHYFKNSQREYYLKQLCYLIITVIAYFITKNINCLIHCSSKYVDFFVRLLLCMVIPNFIYILFYFNTKDFQNAKNFVLKRVLKRY